MVGQGADDASLRHQGRKQQSKAKAKDQAARAEEKAEQKMREASDLDKAT
jgi:uncharacterized protein YjbJ (UPF0337 family)